MVRVKRNDVQDFLTGMGNGAQVLANIPLTLISHPVNVAKELKNETKNISLNAISTEKNRDASLRGRKYSYGKKILTIPVISSSFEHVSEDQKHNKNKNGLQNTLDGVNRGLGDLVNSGFNSIAHPIESLTGLAMVASNPSRSMKYVVEHTKNNLKEHGLLDTAGYALAITASFAAPFAFESKAQKMTSINVATASTESGMNIVEQSAEVASSSSHIGHVGHVGDLGSDIGNEIQEA